MESPKGSFPSIYRSICGMIRASNVDVTPQGRAPPSYELVYNPHYITIDISPVNHRVIGVIKQLGYLGGTTLIPREVLAVS